MLRNVSLPSDINLAIFRMSTNIYKIEYLLFPHVGLSKHCIIKKYMH